LRAITPRWSCGALWAVRLMSVVTGAYGGAVGAELWANALPAIAAEAARMKVANCFMNFFFLSGVISAAKTAQLSVHGQNIAQRACLNCETGNDLSVILPQQMR
jgi:hypothetical protein